MLFLTLVLAEVIINQCTNFKYNTSFNSAYRFSLLCRSYIGLS